MTGLIKTARVPLEDRLYQLLAERLVKTAAESDPPVPSYAMSGRLYMSDRWLLLDVPNALVRGVFQALDEPGIELPPDSTTGELNAHISVMRPEEIERIGGPDKLQHDRGKRFSYTLGKLETVVPAGWSEMARCWMIRVHSPDLMALRRSYGLPSLPNEGKFAFHITVAVRRKGVLGRNEKGKHQHGLQTA